MKLPNPHLVVVDRRKVVEYLLDAAHPDNGGKAQFFESRGFTVDSVERLIDVLREIAVTGTPVRRVESRHGEKYVVDGSLPGHTEARPSRVRTVWMIDRGDRAPRFLTAYPAKK